MKKYKIAVAGTGYVGLSIATLLAQYNKVYALDIVPEKVQQINDRKSPIQDEYIEKYMAEKELDLTERLILTLILLSLPHRQITIRKGIFSIHLR